MPLRDKITRRSDFALNKKPYNEYIEKRAKRSPYLVNTAKSFLSRQKKRNDRAHGEHGRFVLFFLKADQPVIPLRSTPSIRVLCANI